MSFVDSTINHCPLKFQNGCKSEGSSDLRMGKPLMMTCMSICRSGSVAVASRSIIVVISLKRGFCPSNSRSVRKTEHWSRPSETGLGNGALDSVSAIHRDFPGLYETTNIYHCNFIIIRCSRDGAFDKGFLKMVSRG